MSDHPVFGSDWSDRLDDWTARGEEPPPRPPAGFEYCPNGHGMFPTRWGECPVCLNLTRDAIETARDARDPL